jgi:hypothetical protein
VRANNFPMIGSLFRAKNWRFSGKDGAAIPILSDTEIKSNDDS